MHAVSYTTAELSLLCKEYKKALEENNGIRAEKIAEKIFRELERLSGYTPRTNMDSLFFAGELNANGGEYEVQYPESVSAWRQRREERRKQKRQDDDDEAESSGSSSKGHGNTKLPFGLCEKYGIEVQNGWTPREAWEALAGKGVSAKEEYKKLRERGKAAGKAATPTVDHEANVRTYREMKSSLKGKEDDIKKRMFDNRDQENLAYRALLKVNDDLHNAERELVAARSRKKKIAGRSVEELQAEFEKASQEYDELKAINDKYYDKPALKDPARKEWDAWCESLGGRSEILNMLNKGYLSDGAFMRKTEVESTLKAARAYGTDGGYKEASKNVRKLEKQKKSLTDIQDACEAKHAELEKEQQKLYDDLKEAHKGYAEAIKAKFPTFDDCKTVSDVAERLSAEGIFTGESLDADFGNQITRETAIEVSKDLVDYTEKVPFLKGNCHRLAIRNLAGERFGGYDYSDVYGYSDNKEVVLNEKHYRNYEQTKEKYQKNLESNFHPVGTTFNSVVHHEYSHQLDDFMSKKMKLEHGEFSSAVFKSVCEELHMTEAECKTAVSGYSANNISGGAVEWFAEAMSEYTSSKSPRPIAVAVWKEVERRAKELGLIHGDAVEEYRKRRQKRLDAKAEEEEGRWVTTENDNRVHINEEGVPDKGNPYVLAVMRGEGSSPKSSEELARHRIQRRVRQTRALYSSLADAKQEQSKAEKEWAGAKTDCRRIQLRHRVTENEKERIRELGYGADDKDRMQRDMEELEVEMESILQGRDKWNLSEDEKKAYDEVEGKRNILQYHLGYFDDCFGPEAATADKVREAEEKLRAAEERQAKAEKAVEKAQSAVRNTEGSPDQERFLTDQERASTIEAIKNSDMWGEISESGKTKAIESLQNVSDAHLLLLQKTLGNAKIWDSYGRVTEGGSTAWYSGGTGAITLSQYDMDSPKVLWHEYGHYLDDSKESSCNMGTSEIAGYTYQNDLSNELEKAHVLHGESAAADLQKLFDEVAPGELEFGTWGNGILKITNKKTGAYAEDSYDPAFCTICTEIQNKFHEFTFQDDEFDAYCRSIGYPPDREMPKFDDYIEFYKTPKRGLMRQRERFKGAKEEYFRKNREFSEQREKALAEHPEFYDKQQEYSLRCKKREGMIAPVSDILCGMFRGNGPWIYGGHDSKYYSRSDAPYKEAVANYHQMRMMGWTESLNLLKQLVPSVHDALESYYNEWLWRNVDI